MIIAQRFLLQIVVAFSLLILSIFDAIPNQFFNAKDELAQGWLGAPIVIQASQNWQSPLAEEAASVSVKLGAMLIAKDSTALVDLQLIDERYPISGRLQSLNNNALTDSGVWIDQGFAKQRGINVGDQVSLFGKEYVVEDLLVQQDEQVFSPQGLSPTVIMSLSNIKVLGIDQPGFRASWYYYYPKAAQEQFIGADLAGAKLLDTDEQLGRLGRVIDQAQETMMDLQLFCTLLITIILYLVFSYTHQQSAYACGLMKVFGIKTSTRVKRILSAILPHIIIGLFIGGGLSIVVIEQLIPHLAMLGLSIDLFSTVLRAAYMLAAYSSLMLLIFQYQLQKTATIKQLKQQEAQMSNWLVLFIGSIFTVFVVSTTWDSMALISTLIGVAQISIFLVAGSFLVILMLIGHLSGRGQYALVLLNRLRQRPQDSTMLLLAVVLVLVIAQGLWHIRYQSIDSFEQYVPEGSPNYFFLGMTEDDHTELTGQYQWYDPELIYRIVRGQLVAVNGQSVAEYQGGRYLQHEAFNRQLNLTHFSKLPDFNVMLEGELGTGISIEYGIMQRLGLKMGDILTFNILGQVIPLEITSVRSVQWQSLRANFYFVLPEQILDDFPASYLGSLRISDTDLTEVDTAIKDHPSVIYINISEYIKKSQAVIKQVINVLMSLLILGASVIGFAFYVIFYQQQQQRRLEWQQLRRISVHVPYLLTIETGLTFGIAVIIAQALLNIGIYMLNSSRNMIWYYDITSLAVAILLWVVLLAVSLLFDRRIRNG